MRPSNNFLYAFFAVFIISAPALAVNATITQASSSKMNNSDYNATVLLHPSAAANDTSYNATIVFSIVSRSNFSESLAGTILVATLDFYDTSQQNTNQTLSVVVKNEFSALISNATVNGTVVAPDGTRTNISFAEGVAGNYTKSFLLNQIGNYTIGVSVSKTGFNNITSSKNVYVGLIEFASFSGVDVFQGTTAFFDLGLRNKGNASSTVVPFLFIYNSAGSLVFSVQGLSSTVAAGQNVSLFQHNTLTWSAGSTAAGTYNATAYLRFTDTTNTTTQTPNRTFAFQVKAVSTTTTITTGGGGTAGGGGGAVYVVSEEQAVENVPVAEFLQFINIPILIESYPGYTANIPITIFNPTDAPINGIKISVSGIPAEWFRFDKDSSDLQPQDSDVFTVSFSIPNDAQPGNYQGTFAFSNSAYIRNFAFILRINQPAPVQSALVSKTSQVQEVVGNTKFVISVKNKGAFLESLRVTERIDKSIAENVNEVDFSIQPTKVIQADPVVQWVLTNLQPYEERNITYRLKKTLNTTKPFIYTSIEEIVSVERVGRAEPLTINIYDAAVIVPILIIFILVIVHRLRKSRTRESMSEARRLAERLRG